MTSEAAVTPLPRRGRLWVLLILGFVALALGYGIVNIATQTPSKNIGPRRRHRDAQQTLRRRAAGRRSPRLRRRPGDGPGLRRRAVLELPRRLPHDDPGSDRKYARPGTPSSLTATTRTRKTKSSTASSAPRPAAEQGYGWKYAYLFFVNQEEADRFGVTKKSRVPRLARRRRPANSKAEWEEAFEEAATGARSTASLEAQEELGSELGIRAARRR